MIDYTVLVLDRFSFNDFKKFLELIDVEVPNESEKMVTYFENLKVEYYPNKNRLKLKNSLHKFYNRHFAEIKIDGNYNDFCLTQFNVVCDLLSELYFDRSPNDIHISTKFETGVNIDIGAYRPMAVMERYETFQVHNSVNAFETIETWGGTIGKPQTRKAFMSDYQIKFYNKSHESKISNVNLLRMEIVFGQLRKIRSVLGTEGNITLETLRGLNSWRSFGSYITTCYDNIKKVPLTQRGLTIDELNKVYAYCNKGFKKDLSLHLSRHNYSRYMDECKSIYTEISRSEDNFHNSFRDKLSAKLDYLWQN